MIDACARQLAQRDDCVMATVAHVIDDSAEFVNPNVVKVVLDAAGRALYFSRAPIGWWRDGFARGLDEHTALPADPRPLRHVGLYAYRVAFLKRFPLLPHAPLERLESLEQLRVLWHGERIAVHISPERPGPGVDSADDLARVRLLLGAG
jgi:3-deoxy-manno-octulosonate cytidylyltransferase (CMP-KDO synthetase)